MPRTPAVSPFLPFAASRLLPSVPATDAQRGKLGDGLRERVERRTDTLAHPLDRRRPAARLCPSTSASPGPTCSPPASDLAADLLPSLPLAQAQPAPQLQSVPRLVLLSPARPPPPATGKERASPVLTTLARPTARLASAPPLPVPKENFVVKYQTIVREEQEIVVGRVKVPTVRPPSWPSFRRLPRLARRAPRPLPASHYRHPHRLPRAEPLGLETPADALPTFAPPCFPFDVPVVRLASVPAAGPRPP